MFKKSTLNLKLRDGSIPAYHKTIVEGEDAIQVSAEYTMGPNLPIASLFHEGGSTPTDLSFGYRILSFRMIIERAFGWLKGRMGALRRPLDIVDHLLNVIFACFVLHNYCEVHG